jgi:hypothetical protein
MLAEIVTAAPIKENNHSIQRNLSFSSFQVYILMNNQFSLLT